MNSQSYIPKVSASKIPPPGILQKRYFEADNCTIYNNVKIRKLESGVQPLQCSFFSSSTQISQIPQISSHTPSNVSSTSFEFQFAEPAQVPTATYRQKFKARSIPKSLYKPNFTVKSSEKPLTTPQEFPLTTPSPHKFQSALLKTENFKARPMPNFSNPFIPQHFSTPTKPIDFNLTHSSGKYYSMRTPPSSHQFNTPSRSSSIRKCRDFEPTIPMDIELHSTRRAEEREVFDEYVREQERWKEAIARQQMEEKNRVELEEIKLIRKQAEFKARPMPNFKGRVIDWNEDMMDIE